MQTPLSQLLPSWCKGLFFLLLAGEFLAPGRSTLADDRSALSKDESPADLDARTTVRPTEPPKPPNPEELELRPDGERKLRFNFNGQPWLEVLGWLADVSELSLDWQELPAGYLNLRTQRSYTVNEARDLINRHLLDRSFTLLKHGEILSVANTRKLDPSLVPRLLPDELESALPHEFARVTFALDSLTAESAVEELKPLISPNGKLVSLKSTNRLEAIDAAVNLREIHKLLTEEQSPRGRDRLVREFKLAHVRAADVQPQLQKLLGIDKASAAAQGADPAALVQQMAQLMKKDTGALALHPPQKQAPPLVQLVVNARDNSILAHAPADQMAVIAQAVRVIDSPPDKSRSLLRSAHRVQVYPLAVAEPEALIKMLQELGDLDPATRLQVDKKRRAIVAHASLIDHLTIRTLVDKLDGTVRSFHAIKLHRLEADYVASSIDLVVGGGADNGKRPPGRDPEDESRRFRVIADVEHNRLLLWVNDVELDEVHQLLQELGETSAADSEPISVRVLDNLDPAEAHELLRRLQEVWPGVAPNPLELGPGTKSPEAGARDSHTAPEDARPSPKTPLRPDPAAAAPRPRASAPQAAGRIPLRLVGLAGAKDQPDGPAASAIEDRVPDPVPARAQPASQTEASPSAPVRIDRDAEGRLVVASRDVAALELVKKLVSEIGPLHKEFKVFRMKHKNSWAYQIAENLKQFFEEKQKGERATARFYDPGSGKTIDSSRPADNGKPQKPRQPKFIVDSDSNSILAVGANGSQLETIEELIDLYDTAESKDPQPTRITRLVKIVHSQARQVGDAVKDVYHDLLSMNESRERSDQSRERRLSEPRYTYVYNANALGRDLPETLVKFRGQLSIGIDESSNTLIVSAPEALLEDVVETIKALDEASRTSTPRIQVLRVDRSVNAGELQKRLQKMIARPQPQPAPAAPPAAHPAPR